MKVISFFVNDLIGYCGLFLLFSNLSTLKDVIPTCAVSLNIHFFLYLVGLYVRFIFLHFALIPVIRVMFGPDLVMLGPDEQFTQLSISGGKPKKPNVIKALCLLMGPDFCTDIITVETSDHARLSLQLSYNW